MEKFKQTHKKAYFMLQNSFDQSKHFFGMRLNFKKMIKKKNKSLCKVFHPVTLPFKLIEFIETQEKMSEFITDITEVTSSNESESKEELGFVETIVDHFEYIPKMNKNIKGKCKLSNDISLGISLSIWIDIFDSIVNPLVNHIRDLLNSHHGLTHIAMAGGGTESKYVQFRMKSEFGMNSKYKMKFVFPEKPMLCVVDGAIRYALYKEFVTERVMKYTYGVLIGRTLESARKHPNISEEHIEKYKYFDQIEKKYKVRQCFAPFVKKGEIVKHNQVIRRIFGSPQGSCITIRVYASTDPNPAVATNLTMVKERKIKIPPSFDKKKDRIRTTFHFGKTSIKVKLESIGSSHSKLKTKYKMREMEFGYNQ